MHWSDGVHQFLQLKHNLRMTPERMCDSFYSNVTLFKKYQYLYGLSGTLGGKDAQEFIRKVYKIDVVIIPKYIDSIFEIYPGEYMLFFHISNIFMIK
jgi:preprotein translocase subunit SecA